MNSILNAAERRHIACVKALPCSVCDAVDGGRSGSGSDAHHIEQGLHYAVVALCFDCHQGPKMGWHGERLAWKIRKVTMNDALNTTIRRVMGAP